MTSHMDHGYVVYQPGRGKSNPNTNYQLTISLWRKVAKKLRELVPEGWKISASIVGTLDCDYKGYVGPMVEFINDYKHLLVVTNIPRNKHEILVCGEPKVDNLVKLLKPRILAQTKPISQHILSYKVRADKKSLVPIKITELTRVRMIPHLPKLKSLKLILEKSRGFVDASFVVSDVLDLLKDYPLPKKFLGELRDNYSDLRDAREENALQSGSVSLRELKAETSSNLNRVILALGEQKKA